MWFTHALIYQYEGTFPEHLHTLLADHALKPCPPHARFSYGWVPVAPQVWSIEALKSTLFSLGKEERILPRGVIQRALNERIHLLETQRGYPVKRSEKSQLAEELEFELLPKAFCLQKQLFAFFDQLHQRLVINTTSAAQATPLLTALRQSMPQLHLTPLSYPEQLTTTLTQWITHPASRPSHLQLATDCILFSPDDEHKRFQCKGTDLPSEEVLSLLSQGLSVEEVSLIWNERIQLTLTQHFTFKRIKCLDALTEDFHEIQAADPETTRDAVFTLLSGELRALINDLLNCASTSFTFMTNNIKSEL